LISFSFGSVFFFFVTQSKEKENEQVQNEVLPPTKP